MSTPEDDRLLRAALEDAQHQVKQLTKEVTRLRALNPDALLEQVARLQNQIAQLEQQHDVADQVRATWLAERASLREEVARLTALVQVQQQQLERADEVRSDWHAQLSALQEELRRARDDVELSTADSSLALDEVADLRRQLDVARRALERRGPGGGSELDGDAEAGHKPSS